MIKFLSSLVLLLSAFAQDAIICSGFIRIPKVEKTNIDLTQIEMKLLGPNNQFIDYIEISENGFYSVEIEDNPSSLIDYIISIQPKVRGFIASPSQINLKFQSKSFDEASAFCNKQLNFSIKRVEDSKQSQKSQKDIEQQELIKKQKEEEIKRQQREEELKRQQREEEIRRQQREEQLRLERLRQEEEERLEQIRLEKERKEQEEREEQERQEQLRLEREEQEREQQRLEEERRLEETLNPELEDKIFDHLRLIGQFTFDGDFTENEKALYYIKSFKVLDNSDEQIQGRTLYFNNYFEVEVNDPKILKLNLVVEKAKEKGESVNKQFTFEKKISKNSLLNRQISNQPVNFEIKKEILIKEQNKISQIFAPLIIFALVLAVFNYDKILKKW